MISGFLSPGDPYLWILIYQITAKNLREMMETCSKNAFGNMGIYLLEMWDSLRTELFWNLEFEILEIL